MRKDVLRNVIKQKTQNVHRQIAVSGLATRIYFVYNQFVEDFACSIQNHFFHPVYMPAPIVGAGDRVKRYQSFNFQVSPASFTDAGIFIDEKTKNPPAYTGGFSHPRLAKGLADKKGY